MLKVGLSITTYCFTDIPYINPTGDNKHGNGAAARGPGAFWAPSKSRSTTWDPMLGATWWTRGHGWSW